jgi:protein-disulfide isomerase
MIRKKVIRLIAWYVGVGVVLACTAIIAPTPTPIPPTATAAATVASTSTVTPVSLTPQPGVYDIETEGYPSLGPADAPITIVEFSDYQCPFCYRWHAEVYDQLQAAYPGKLRLVYRNFPLSFHQNAFAAAEAALCAGDQTKYWEYHDALFERHEILNNQSGTVLEQAEYDQMAEDLNLDVAAFAACMTSRKYQTFIKNDMQYAAALPVDYENGQPVMAVGGTPTFFINGRRLGGAYPFEYFKTIIDAELAKK